MNKVVINIADDGYHNGLMLSKEAIIKGYEIGLFTKKEYKKNNNIYYEIPRHHPLLIKLIEDPTISCTDDIFSFDPMVQEIDSNIYSIVRDENGSEEVITQDDKYFNWIKI